MNNNQDDILFADEDDNLFADEPTSVEKVEANNLTEDKPLTKATFNKEVWKIMLVDDEKEVHTVTKFALRDYQYQGKKLEFIHAYSGREAIELLEKNPDVALIFLDVVMEHNHAGLEVVENIRKKLNNQFVRIILRTGQPGQAPEEEIIVKYDINDYKNKTELTDKKLFTTITTGLRSYSDIMEIENYRQNLERMVEERTKEIKAQKNEILQQKEAIHRQNLQILGSIQYAQRIQEAMLPPFEEMSAPFEDLFVLFKPRDIVSGDFYWFYETPDKVFISAIDCTGHGVPGAFMSMIGDSLLNQIVMIDGFEDPELILQKLNDDVYKALNQGETQNKDGMVLAFCVIHKKEKILKFAGAKNTLVYIQNNQLYETQADKFSIGGFNPKETGKFFTSQTIDLSVPTYGYMSTDGFPDQFGGPQNRKFMSKNMRDLFFQIHQKPFAEQKEILDRTIEAWKGDQKQTDDILIIGFKTNF
ncbi:MAG: SpoIIE family protein phosphatase [Microscillaceae bacterium]|nr:SpoIIE family protein phosphatase [Microscillaceae bacterium]MDW8460666.1 SpoIIE family protein phosphatase [Cytophagales bacterium]